MINYLTLKINNYKLQVNDWPGPKRGFLGYRRYYGFFFSNFYKSVIGEYRKLGFQKVRDFQTFVFSIYTIGQYRKHRCLKTADFFEISVFDIP